MLRLCQCGTCRPARSRRSFIDSLAPLTRQPSWRGRARDMRHRAPGLEEPGRTYCRSVAYYLPKSFVLRYNNHPLCTHLDIRTSSTRVVSYINVSACITYDFLYETFLATSTLTGLAPPSLLILRHSIRPLPSSVVPHCHQSFARFSQFPPASFRLSAAPRQLWTHYKDSFIDRRRTDLTSVLFHVGRLVEPLSGPSHASFVSFLHTATIPHENLCHRH